MIGNPGPDWNGDKRAGDNLYSDCVVALDADTGKLKWYFQFTPHDDFDYDSVQVPVLADIDMLDRARQPRKVMMWANRNGFFYTLDRTTGKFLQGKPFVEGDLGHGARRSGRPMRAPEHGADGRRHRDLLPGHRRHQLVFAVLQSADRVVLHSGVGKRARDLQQDGRSIQRGQLYMGGASRTTLPGLRAAGQLQMHNEADGYGAVRALDPQTGEKKWEFKMTDVTASGILTTASDLLFTGGREGFFQALDARTGKLLWKTNAGGEIAMGPMTYQVNGKQYVAFSAGSSMFVYGLR